ncbi:MAG: YraN family protein [Steroidobacteraceae bacterium]|nr:YraN family protein [Steroidobacteraceae bacterium]
MPVDRAGLGRRAEDLAAADLEARGAQVLLRNWRRRCGELDLVAREGSTLVIVEVRMRSGDEYGGAAASVDRAKQRRIVLATRQLLQQHRELARFPVRFDVAVVSPGTPAWRVQWIRHAFETR